MKLIIFIFCALFGIAFVFLGAYIGIWWMLMGGVVNCIEGAKADPVNALMIAKGVAKIVFFEVPVIGGIMFGVVCFQAGAHNSCKKSKRHW